MSGFEGAVSSILQGVSQQLPKLRLQGQLTAQDNMISDIVTNLRRRPGLMVKNNFAMAGEDGTSVRAWETDIGGQRVHVYVGTKTGRLMLVNETLTTLLFSNTYPYLVATVPQAIRPTTVGDYFFMLNVEQQMAAGAAIETNVSPSKLGFFYIKAGAFSKNYSVVVSTNLGKVTLDYTTPSGTGATDAANSTPEAIATNLVNATNLTALSGIGVGMARTGAYVYFAGPTVTSLAVASPSGSAYLTVSNTSKVRLESDLPAILPDTANGYVMAVGDTSLFRYYKWNSSTVSWVECGVWGSPGTITNGPLRVTYTSSAFVVDRPTLQGRLAGDDDTNEIPKFTTRKASGLGTFQSRLVILCGPLVYLSSSGDPLQFFRSTVTSLIASDTIAVGSSANSSAEYQYAVPFQKDLLLFSQKYQALIPSSGVAITPSTATVLLTSAYSTDVTSEPVPVGRTLLFAAPRSSNYFGFMEMVSSQYTDSQYVANDATAHIPKYMGGKCRFGVASSVASMVLFAPSGDTSSLVVYEYSWDGDTKVQQAWHTWRFRYPVAAAYFTNEVINIVFVQNGILLVCTLDPRQGAIMGDASTAPYLDINAQLTVTNNTATLPAWLMTFDPNAARDIALAVATGDLGGEEIGVAGYSGSTITTVRSFPSGLAYYGFKYRSLMSPTPPIVQDRNNIKIESAKLTLLRFGVSTQNSAEFKVMITDSLSEEIDVLEQATLYYSSAELELGHARNAIASRAVIPARTDADTTSLVMYTDGTGEMNFVGIDYTGRFNQKLRRR